MALTLLRVYRSGAGVEAWGTAAAPSGGFYVAADFGLALARVNGAGTIAWQKALAFSGLDDVGATLVSSATHVALVRNCYDTNTLDEFVDVSLYDSSGTLAWQTTLPLNLQSVGVRSGTAALGPSNDIAVLGYNPGSVRLDLVRLSGANGSVSWTANVAPAGNSANLDLSDIQFLSGGDIVLLVKASTTHYLQRINGSNGAVVWSRNINWTTGTFSGHGLAVDPSDNVYVWGVAIVGPNGPELPVIKVDSSGTLLWSKEVAPPSVQSPEMDFPLMTGRGMANAAGVFIPGALRTDYAGHIFVPTDGTGNAILTRYYKQFAAFNAARTGGETGAQLTAGFSGVLTTYEEALLISDLNDAADDGTHGGITRATFTFDLAAGAATIGSNSYTRAATVGVVATTPVVATVSAGNLLAASIVQPTAYVASGLAPGTAFGTATSSRIYTSTGTSTTAFGLPSLGFYATGSVFAQTFGTPAYQPNTTKEATGLASTLAFGLPWSERGDAPGPRVASSVGPTVLFGEATALGLNTCVAEGANTTVFGQPAVRLSGAVTGFAVGAFGTPALRMITHATSVARSTAFGLPMTAGFGGVAGFTTTRLGQPLAVWSARGVATGWSGTAFGAASALRAQTRTRSGVFRTRFGLAQCERTAP